MSRATPALWGFWRPKPKEEVMTFEGISRDGLELLRTLPTLDKAAFAALRTEYRHRLREPIEAFVDALGSALRTGISPGIQFAAKTHGSIGPINNDVRFNPDAPTYKDHVLLTFWEGRKKKTAPALYTRLTATDCGFASGAVFDDVDAWREAVDSDGETIAAMLATLLEATGGTVVGQDLKRVPVPYDPEHTHGDLLRHKWIQVRWARPLPDSVGTAAFVDYCARELAQAAAVHRWLVGTLS